MFGGRAKCRRQAIDPRPSSPLGEPRDPSIGKKSYNDRTQNDPFPRSLIQFRWTSERLDIGRMILSDSNLVRLKQQQLCMFVRGFDIQKLWLRPEHSKPGRFKVVSVPPGLPQRPLGVTSVTCCVSLFVIDTKAQMRKPGVTGTTSIHSAVSPASSGAAWKAGISARDGWTK